MPENACFTFSTVWFTFSRNSSLVLYRYINPAANAAIAATTIPTGDAIADNTPGSPPNFETSPPTFVIIPTIPDVTFPTVDIAFPAIISAGATAATIAAILAIICFCESSKFLNHDVKSLTFCTTLSIVGCSIDKNTDASSAPDNFKLFVATVI